MRYISQRIIGFLTVAGLAMCLLPLHLTADVPIPSDYTDNTAVQAGLAAIFAEYPPGSYFTNDGKPCDCHGGIKCCTGQNSCNCKRMYGNIDLLSWQCFGFARYSFYKLFGFLDTSANAAKITNAGKIAAGDMTADNLKALIGKTKTGAHIRATDRHSMVFLASDNNGFHVMHANWDGKCGVSMLYFTWSSFVTRYKSTGIEYVKQPKDYPESTGYQLDISGMNRKVAGEYSVNADLLYVRSGPGKGNPDIGSLKNGVLVTILEIGDGWGRIDYNGATGWISLDYADLVSPTVSGITAAAVKERIFVVGYTLRPEDFEVIRHFGPDFSAPLPTGYTVTGDCAAEGTTVVRIDFGSLSSSVEIAVVAAAKPTEDSSGYIIPDVNGDGIFNAADARLVLRYALEKAELTEDRLKIADVDGDGTVGIKDARLILRMALNKVPLPSAANNPETVPPTTASPG